MPRALNIRMAGPFTLLTVTVQSLSVSRETAWSESDDSMTKATCVDTMVHRATMLSLAPPAGMPAAPNFGPSDVVLLQASESWLPLQLLDRLASWTPFTVT